MLDYVQHMFTDFSEIHGDRAFGDDAAMICGMARFHGEEVLVVGTQKGRDTKQKVYRNFGMPNPGGLPQGDPGHADGGEVRAADISHLSIRREPIRDWAPKSADRARRLRITCARCRG